MPVKRSYAETNALRMEALRTDRLALQREIADQVREQQRVYDEVLRPNASNAKLLASQIKGGGHYEGKPLSPEMAKNLEGKDAPTARFEWARAEIERISKLVATKRRTLGKVEEELASLRAKGTPAHIDRVGVVPTILRDMWQLARSITLP